MAATPQLQGHDDVVGSCHDVFFGFLGVGEVVTPGDNKFDPTCHLAQGDVRINDLQDPKFVVVRIKSTKQTLSGKVSPSIWAGFVAACAQ